MNEIIFELEIIFPKPYNIADDYDIGSITLKNKGREYKLEALDSYWYSGSESVLVESTLKEDREIHNDPSSYSLELEDLESDTLKGAIYLSGEFKEKKVKATLNVFTKKKEKINIINLEVED